MKSGFQTVTGSLIAFAALILGDLGHFAHRLELGVNRACSAESKQTLKVFQLQEHGKRILVRTQKCTQP